MNKKIAENFSKKINNVIFNVKLKESNKNINSINFNPCMDCNLIPNEVQ